MVDWWWWALVGTAVPASVARYVLKNKQGDGIGRSIIVAQGAGERKSGADGEGGFVCERVCTSKRMLNRVGAFSKDSSPDTCVTVCGVSDVDACTDACSRTVCLVPHHVPNWNDICMRRCTNQCLKLHRSS